MGDDKDGCDAGWLGPRYGIQAKVAAIIVLALVDSRHAQSRALALNSVTGQESVGRITTAKDKSRKCGF